ncbi:MAG TPA: hypothetical protein VN328_02760 [Thermodesulfovibrionales bacterium]|nr:hypothetical protein [Thermodesulfovibrionales bacterium]
MYFAKKLDDTAWLKVASTTEDGVGVMVVTVDAKGLSDTDKIFTVLVYDSTWPEHVSHGVFTRTLPETITSRMPGL